MRNQHVPNNKPRGADAAIDLNNELKTRREKLAALREQGRRIPERFPS
ncbi:hypothetical protein LNQ03_22450 [Klebsiella pneumoniae subsp. pneumoniae]|nr:hypothetical protein [Klebsiella pneumoniae subsp. pneumoniae]